jgi:thiamine biosynthesis lipoprotein
MLVAGCGGQAPEETGRHLTVFEGAVMGTTYTVRIVTDAADAEREASVAESLTEAVSRVDDLMTTYRDSEVTRFNASRSTEPFAVSPETAEVASLALELAAVTGGAVDVTVGPLVEAFGFGPTESVELPSEERLADLRPRIGHSLLTVDPEGRLVKAHPELTVDFSAVAKGYGVDRAAAVLDELGITDYMIELGGEVRTLGLNERGLPWRIGVERPRAARGAVQRIVPLSGLSMATSGDYRQYREVDGRRISHIIDPRSSQPIEHSVASATVLHESCATADGLATAMIVLGEDGLRLAEENGWAVLLLVRSEDGFREATSSAFDALIDSPEASAA